MRSIYQRIFDSVQISIVLVDRKFTVIKWNKATEKIYGIAQSQVLGKNLLELFPDLKRIKLHKYIKQAFESGKETELKEKLRKTLIKGELYIDYFISPVFKKDKVEFTAIVSRDVSERVKLRNDLSEKNERFAILYDIAKALFSTLYLEEVFFLILTGITNPRMDGFDRAALFLRDKDINKHLFTGKMGISSKSGATAHKIWKKFLKNPKNFNDFRVAYEEFQNNITPTFNSYVQGLGLFEKELFGKKRLRGIKKFKKGARGRKPPEKLIEYFNCDQLVLVPIYIESDFYGLIYVDNQKSNKEFTKGDIEFLELSTNLATLAIQLSRRYEKTYQYTIRDSLTRLFNHRRFYSVLKKQIQFAEENRGKVSLIMFDIDYFKKFNDTFGHPEGDRLLREIANIIKENIRNIDYPARYGGEEFAVILPNVDKQEAYLIADRIREIVETFEFEKKKQGTWGSITISGGVSNYPDDAGDLNQLVKMADDALYTAKDQGRNRIVKFSDEIYQHE